MKYELKKTFFNKLCDALEFRDRTRTLAQLRRMDPRLVADAGFSTEQLDKGVAAWPWRMEEPTTDGINPAAAVTPILTRHTVVNCSQPDTSKSTADFAFLAAAF